MRIGINTVDAASVQAIFAIGYPTFASEVDFRSDEDGVPTALEMELRWVKLYLTPDVHESWDPPNRQMMKQDQRTAQETIEPDGMSGAPVFFVWLDPSRQAHLGFAGIITHAGGCRYAVYDGTYIRMVVDRYINNAEV